MKQLYWSMHRLLASIVNFDSSFTLMKTLRNTFATLSIISIALTGNAQTINCDRFTVTGLEPDTFDLNNTLINIEMGGGIADFANYPYIPSITDCNGDTVATGSMFFFGQIGGTVQGYPVSAISDDVCLPLTIEFIYGNDLFLTDTCLLTFGSTDITYQFDKRNQLHVYPNPTQGAVLITSSPALINESYFLFDQLGKMVEQGILNSSSTRIDMGRLSSGIYMLHVGNEVVKVMKD